MAKFLVGTIPAIGHITPLIPIVSKLVKRGHEVWWQTGKFFESKIEATGARFMSMKNALDYSIPSNIPEDLQQQRKALKGLEQLKFDLKNGFINLAKGQVQDFTDLLQDFPADVLLVDSYVLGAQWIHEQIGIPWAQLGSNVLSFSSPDVAPFGLGMQPNASILGRLRNRSLNYLFQKIIFGDILTYTNKVRDSLGLLPTAVSFFDNLSSYLYLAPTLPAFEYPRSYLPPQVHFVGPLFPKSSASEFTPPSWWDELKGDKPIIHVTQGTVATEAQQLIIPTLQALAEEDVLVVATTGGQPIDSIKLDPMPKNARIEEFIPHSDLLPYVDVMITNGGYNGVSRALANGVPLVAAGKTEDKPEVCARIEWSGVGINLKTNTPSPHQIGDSVKKILAEPQFKARAKYFQNAIAKCDPPTHSAELLEELARTKKPVLRAEEYN